MSTVQILQMVGSHGDVSRCFCEDCREGYCFESLHMSLFLDVVPGIVWGIRKNSIETERPKWSRSLSELSHHVGNVAWVCMCILPNCCWPFGLQANLGWKLRQIRTRLCFLCRQTFTLGWWMMGSYVLQRFLDPLVNGEIWVFVLFWMGVQKQLISSRWSVVHLTMWTTGNTLHFVLGLKLNFPIQLLLFFMAWISCYSFQHPRGK